MESFSEKEREQIKKFDQMRKLLQMILMQHVVPLSIFFGVALVVSIVGVYVSASRSAHRYESTVILHYTTTGRSDSTKALSPKYVLDIFNRKEIRQTFAAKYRMKYGIPVGKCEISTAPLPDKRGVLDRFKITINAPDERTAIRLANDFAEHCLEAYAREYAASLQKQLDEFQHKKEEALLEKKRLKRESQQLCASKGISDPKIEYEQLKHSIPNSERKLKSEELQLETLELKYNELNARMKAFNPALVTCEKELRRWLADRKKLDDDIDRYRYEYTESNSKMIALRSRRTAMEDGFRKFLKDQKLALSDLDQLDAALLLHTELVGVSAKLGQKKNQVRVLLEGITADRKKMSYIDSIIPQIDILAEQLRTQDESLARLQASISDIRSRLVKDSMRIGERSESARKINPLGAKNTIFCILFSALLTTLLASLIVMRDFFLGVITGEKDFTLISGVTYLGSLPSRAALFESKGQAQIAISSIYHAFQNHGAKHQVVLVSTLPGGKILPELFDTFECNYAIGGMRTLTIDLMLAENFNYDITGGDDMGIIVHSGNKGVLPVISKKYLSPSEVELLKNDLETLRKSYDLIFIRHSASMRRDRMFIEQIVPLCDCALFAAGLRKTTRKNLRRLAAIGERTGLPIMTILSYSSPTTGNKRNNLEVGA